MPNLSLCVPCTWCTKKTLNMEYCWGIGHMRYHAWAMGKLLAISNHKYNASKWYKHAILHCSSFVSFWISFAFCCCFFLVLRLLLFLFYLILFFNASQTPPFVQYPIYRVYPVNLDSNSIVFNMLLGFIKIFILYILNVSTKWIFSYFFSLHCVLFVFV